MKNKRVLYIVLALLVLSLGYAYWRWPRQERAAAQGPAVRSAPVKAAQKKAKAARELPAAVKEGDRVRLDLLTPEKGKYPGVRQNLFASLYAAKPTPPPAPLPPPPVKLPPAPVAPVPPPVPVPVEPVEPILPELARFTFLGFLQKEGEKTIFLTSGGEIFLVKKGDRFGRSQQFLITGLTPEQLIIQQGDDPRPIMISLVEQAPLTPARSGPQLPNGAPGAPGGRPFGPSRTGSPGLAPPPAAVESEGVEEVPPAPTEPPVTGGTEPAPQETATGEGGVMRPLPRSDFNNLFSSGSGRRGGGPPGRPDSPTASEESR